MTWFNKFKAAAKEFGLPGACIYAAHRTLGLIGGGLFYYRLVAQPVARAPLLPGGRGRTVTVRQVGIEELIQAQMPLDRKVIEYRFGQRAICLATFKGTQMIGYLWLCLGPYREDEVRSSFVPTPSERCAWDFDVYILPKYRLGIGFLRLWDEANRLLRSQGISWSMSRISAFNRVSLASHGKLGTQVVGSVMFLHLGRMQLALASIRPRFHLSFGPARIPQYVLRAPKVERKSWL